MKKNKKMDKIAVGTTIGNITGVMIHVIGIVIPALAVWFSMGWVIETMAATGIAWNYVLMIAMAIGFVAVIIGVLLYVLIVNCLCDIIIYICEKITGEKF